MTRTRALSTKTGSTTMTDISTEERIRILQERRQGRAGGDPRRSKRTPPARASRMAVLGVSTTMMLGMMAGMGWNAALSAAEAGPSPAGVTAAAQLSSATNPALSGVLGETRSGVGAVPPAPLIPTRQTLSITRSGGSR